MEAVVYRGLAPMIAAEEAAFVARGGDPGKAKGSFAVLSEKNLYSSLFPFVPWPSVKGAVGSLRNRNLLRVIPLMRSSGGADVFAITLPDGEEEEKRPAVAPKDPPLEPVIPRDFIHSVWNRASGVHHFRIEPEDQLVRLRSKAKGLTQKDILQAFERFAYYHEMRAGLKADFGFGDQVFHFARNLSVFLDEGEFRKVLSRHSKKWREGKPKTASTAGKHYEPEKKDDVTSRAKLVQEILHAPFRKIYQEFFSVKSHTPEEIASFDEMIDEKIVEDFSQSEEWKAALDLWEERNWKLSLPAEKAETSRRRYAISCIRCAYRIFLVAL